MTGRRALGAASLALFKGAGFDSWVFDLASNLKPSDFYEFIMDIPSAVRDRAQALRETQLQP